MPVFPEAFGILLVVGNMNVHVFLLLDNLDYVVHAFVEQIGVVAVNLDYDDGYGMALIFLALGLVVNGLHILGIELFHGRNVGVVALFAYAVAQGHKLTHHNGSCCHAATKEFQAHDAAELGFGVRCEAGFGNDAVRSFLLHAWQAPKSLVCHVLAKARQTHFVALQPDHIAHAPADILYGKDGRLFRENLVSGMIFALDGNNLARRGHHAPPKQIVNGGSVFEGHGTTGIFGDIAANGGGCLGGRVNREDVSCPAHCVNDSLGDAAGLTGDSEIFRIHRRNLVHACHADNDCAPPCGNCAASHARTAAPGNEGKLQLVGQLDELRYLLGCGRFHHKKGQLHAQIRGVRGRGHYGGRIREDAVLGKKLQKFLQKTASERDLCLPGRPEHGNAFGDGRGIIVRKRQ